VHIDSKCSVRLEKYSDFQISTFLPAQDNLHNVQIGKLCQDYAKIMPKSMKKVETTMETLQSLHERMARQKPERSFEQHSQPP
jgi:hypothetical protein